MSRIQWQQTDLEERRNPNPRRGTLQITPVGQGIGMQWLGRSVKKDLSVMLETGPPPSGLPNSSLRDGTDRESPKSRTWQDRGQWNTQATLNKKR